MYDNRFRYGGEKFRYNPEIPTAYPTAPAAYKGMDISPGIIAHYNAMSALQAAVNSFMEDSAKEKSETKCVPGIKTVIRHDRATIIYWDDNTRTVVKCKEGDMYDPYYGFCACVCKKLYGGSSAVRDIARIPREPRPKKSKRDKTALSGRSIVLHLDLVDPDNEAFSSPAKPKTYSEWVDSFDKKIAKAMRGVGRR